MRQLTVAGRTILRAMAPSTPAGKNTRAQSATRSLMVSIYKLMHNSHSRVQMRARSKGYLESLEVEMSCRNVCRWHRGSVAVVLACRPSSVHVHLRSATITPPILRRCIRDMGATRSLVRAGAQVQSHTFRRTFTTSSLCCRAFQGISLFPTSPMRFIYKYADGDVALLKDKKNHNHEGILVKLQASKTLSSHRGDIKHADVIGKEPRQLVQSSRGNAYRIHEPTLAEYVRLTPRIVTPVRLAPNCALLLPASRSNANGD